MTPLKFVQMVPKKSLPPMMTQKLVMMIPLQSQPVPMVPLQPGDMMPLKPGNRTPKYSKPMMITPKNLASLFMAGSLSEVHRRTKKIRGRQWGGRARGRVGGGVGAGSGGGGG